jgi:hypothetical protein
MTNDEAYQVLQPLVGPLEQEALDTLYKNAKVSQTNSVGSAERPSYISYKQYKFLVNLAVAGGTTLSDALAERGIAQGEKPWHIDRTAGKKLIDEFINLGYRDNLPKYN